MTFKMKYITFSNICTNLTFEDFFKMFVEKTSEIKREARMKTIKETLDLIVNGIVL